MSLFRHLIALVLSRGLYGPTFFDPAHCHSGKISPARPGRLQPTLNTIFTSGHSIGRKWRNTLNSSEEFKHNLHTCKVQISEPIENAVFERGFKQTTTGGCTLHYLPGRSGWRHPPPVVTIPLLHCCFSMAL